MGIKDFKRRALRALESSKNYLKTADRLTVCLMTFVLVGTLTVMTAFAADDENDKVDSSIAGAEVSISNFSGIMSDAFNNMVSAATNTGSLNELMTAIDDLDAVNNSSISIIGNFLGIKGAADDATNKSDVWTKGRDNASKRISLNSIIGFYGVGQFKSGKHSAMAAYLMFGSALSEMGVDEFRDAESSSEGVRMIIGYLMYICFILAYSASGIMSKVVEIMSDLNIFNLLFNNNGTILGVSISESPFLANIYGVYENYLKPFRFVIFGFMVMFFVASITVFKSKQMNHAAAAQTRFKNLCLRFAIMAIGLPFVGMIYTECLEMTHDSLTETEYNITDYIFSEFMNYRGWVLYASEKAFKIDDSDVNKLKVTYDTSLDRMVITDPSGNDLNVCQFVYGANASYYSGDNGGFTFDTNGIKPIFEQSGNNNGASGSVYSDLIQPNRSSSSNAYRYKACRDLILAYAKSEVVDPDRLNDYYLTEYKYIANSLPTPPAGDETNQQQVTNSEIMSQLFGVNSADQRIWAYVEQPGTASKWAYSANDKDRELKLSEGDSTVTVKLSGVAGYSGVGENYVKIEGGSSPVDFAMGGVLWPSTRVVTTTSSGSTAHGSALTTRGIKVTAYSTTPSATSGHTEEGHVMGASDAIELAITYDLSNGGMSPLSLYNYLNTKFEKSYMDVYTPDDVTNAGVGLAHYAITTPYSGIPELIQLIYVLCVMFSIGIIGWMFGISLLMNTIVQTIKAIPTIFKMVVGSLQGFVEALLTVFSIISEMVITILLYTWSIDIIDFIVMLVQNVATVIIESFVNIDDETKAIVTGLISTLVILWAVLELIKWRQAITMSIKSLLTHVLNQMFGTSAQMPTGASSGMLQAGAALATGAFAANALAEDGTLDDVVNDLTGSDIGSSVMDKVQDGDISGAIEDVKDYAGGVYRGSSSTADAEKEMAAQGRLSDHGEGSTVPNGYQTNTEEQQAQLDALEDEAKELESNGHQVEANEKRAEARKLQERFTDENFRKAAAHNQAHPDDLIYDYGAAQNYDDSGEGEEDAADREMPEMKGADIPDNPSKTLDRDGQSAYTAAKEGDVRGLQTAADTYNKDGLTAEQAESVDLMVDNGATSEEVAAAVDNYAQSNFGDNYADVIGKINEAAGRTGNAPTTYGSADSASGREVSVRMERSDNGGVSYGISDSNGGGMQDIRVVDNGNGATSYQNMTATAAGERLNTVQTMDMGRAVGAVSYGQAFNNSATLIQSNGGAGAGIGGGGGANVMSTSEMTMEVSRQQMASNNVQPVVTHYGDSSQQFVQQQMNGMQVQTVNTNTNQAETQSGFNNVMQAAMMMKAVDAAFGNDDNGGQA